MPVVMGRKEEASISLGRNDPKDTAYHESGANYCAQHLSNLCWDDSARWPRLRAEGCVLKIRGTSLQGSEIQ